MEVVVNKNGTVDRAQVANLSCGGVLLLCNTPFEKGNGLTVHLASVTRGAGILPAESEIVWLADQGSSDMTFRYKLGACFLDLGHTERNSLD